MSDHAHAHDDSHSHDQPHAVPLWLLTAVLLVLLFLTFITVAVTWVDLGSLNIWLALGIAVVKAAIVGAFFMHLYWDAPFNGFILLASICFVAIFIGLSLVDTSQYKPTERPPATAVTPAQ